MLHTNNKDGKYTKYLLNEIITKNSVLSPYRPLLLETQLQKPYNQDLWRMKNSKTFRENQRDIQSQIQIPIPRTTATYTVRYITNESSLLLTY